MSACAVSSIRAYLPLPAPAFVFLSSNDKFVAVKAPLDFFTPAELERFAPLGSIYYPKFVEKTRPFVREAAQLSTRLELVREARQSLEPGPAPFEVSNEFLEMSGRLWSEGGVVEPFFVSVFVHELCGPIPGQWMDEVYARSVGDYEQAVLRSAWAGWQALHLGYCNLHWLQRLRNGVFRVAARLVQDRSAVRRILPETWMIETATREIPINAIGMDRTLAAAERLKLASRAERLRTELIRDKDSFTSIFGPGGFRDG